MLMGCGICNAASNSSKRIKEGEQLCISDVLGSMISVGYLKLLKPYIKEYEEAKKEYDRLLFKNPLRVYPIFEKYLKIKRTLLDQIPLDKYEIISDIRQKIINNERIPSPYDFYSHFPSFAIPENIKPLFQKYLEALADLRLINKQNLKLKEIDWSDSLIKQLIEEQIASYNRFLKAKKALEVYSDAERSTAKLTETSAKIKAELGAESFSDEEQKILTEFVFGYSYSCLDF